MRNLKKHACVILMMVLGLNCGASEQTIYYHGFDGEPDAPLNGEGLEEQLGWESWSANEVFRADGVFDWDGSNPPRGVAVVPITLEPGHTYTISMSAEIYSSAHENHGFGVGLWNTAGGLAHSPLGTQQRVAAIITRASGRILAYESESSFIYASPMGAYQPDEIDTLMLRLVTSKDGESPWKVEYYAGDELLFEHLFSEVPTVTHIAIGTAHGAVSPLAGKINQFKVEVEETDEASLSRRRRRR